MKAKKFTAFIAALAMIISILPMSLINTAAEEEPIRLTSARFRSHPTTYSIFEKTDNLPRNMLWAEFNTVIDHSENYNEDTRTYHLEDGYYQIEISRPQHGPSEAPHPAASIVPKNDITGTVKDEILGGTHRYHGWEIGKSVEEDGLFEADNEVKYQVGDYTVNLNKLTTEQEPATFDETKSMPHETVSTKDLKLIHVTYTLSQADKDEGYRLKCPMEQEAQEQIQELAQVGDMPAIIAPKADSTDVKGEGVKKVVTGWKVVKNEEGTELSGAIGNYLRDDGADGFADDKPEDNEIKLQAILKEPTSYEYDITKDADGAESAFPEIKPTTSAEPASFNVLAGSTEAPKTIEYNPTEAADSLTLHLVNKGNVREYIQIKSDNDNFDLKLNNMNAGKGNADQLYSEGGLSDGNSQFYIPSKADIDQAPDSGWVNYAQLIITPKKGLTVGTHTAEILTRCYNSRCMIWNICKLKIDISQKEVYIEPQSTEKSYGQVLTDANITCKVYDDDDGSTLLEQDKTAAQLGVNVTSDGMAKDAAVNGGEKYPFTAVKETSNSNYKVTLKSGTNTGITVKKTTPRVNTVSATGIKDGAKLSTSKVSGMYVNSYSHEDVKGTWDWVNGEDVINEGQSTVISREYQFTPEDLDNYEKPDVGKVNVVVSAKIPTNLKAKPSSLTKTYNGKPQSPSFTWERDGWFREELVTVTYKKVEDGNLSFDGEDYSDYKAEAPTEAGTYKVHATCPETNSQVRAYSAGDTTAIFTIAPLTLQPDFSGSVINKAYDGTTNATINPDNVKFKNKVTASDDVKIKESAIEKATFADAGYDPHYTKNVTVSVNGNDALEGANASNYMLVDTLKTYHTTGYISSQRPIKLELTAAITKPYGVPFVLTAQNYQAAAAGQPENGGLVSTDSISDVKATLTATDTNGADGMAAEAAVGSYTVKAATPQVSGYNYSITDDALGTLEVVRANPKVEGSVTAPNGKVGNTLSSVTPEGAFVNENNASMKVEGDLHWKAPQTQLTEGKQSYEWEFVPTDNKNYNTISGTAYVTAGDKEPVPITFDETNKEVTYDGNSHAVTATSTVQGTEITIEYAKTDIALHSETTGTVEWLRAAPKDAGTYEVRATATVTGTNAQTYAGNVETTTLTILQAEPEGSVKAGNVDKGAYLSASALTPSFKGVDGEPLAGEVMWRYQDGIQPGLVLVEENKDYEWEFDPTDDNYASVRGKTQITFNTNTRKAEAEIYNLPADYDSIGDYARVNVDGTNLKAGDKIQFFRDAQMEDPESDIIEITEGMSGKEKVNIDDDALNTGSGVLYLHIEGSSAVAEIPYKTQIGFRLDPTQVYIKQSDEPKTISLAKSDDSYVLQSAEWTAPQDGAVTVTPAQGGASATVKGNAAAGNVSITVTATFAHPDPLETGKTVTTTNYATVTVTDEQAPDYEYTTKPATNVTATGATLNGHIKITTYGDAITPNAVGMFLIWEKNSNENITRYGDKSPIVFSTAGEHDYTLAVDGLKPNTEYMYQAVGMAGATVTTGNPVSFKTGEAEPEPTPTPTATPTVTPTEPTATPTATPTVSPTDEPTATPTVSPTDEPTATPTASPTDEPTATPSVSPTAEPTATPSASPTDEPTATPTASPTDEPTTSPSAEPTSDPTAEYAINGIEITETGVKVSVTNADKALLIVASYSADGKLIAVSFEKIEASDAQVKDMKLNTEGASFVKAFIWDSMSNPKPLCEPKSEQLKTE